MRRRSSRGAAWGPRSFALVAGLAMSLVSLSLTASDGPPWREANDLPLPEGARSVRLVRGNVPVFREPSSSSERRGTAIAGVRLPLFGAKRATGCAGRFLNIGPWAWICQDALEFDSTPADAPLLDHDPWDDAGAIDGLPYRYYFVGHAGTSGYGRLEDAERVSPERDFDPGFALAIVEEREREGVRYGQIHHGLWVPMRDLVAAVPIDFRGEELVAGRLDFGWVVADGATVAASPKLVKAPPRTAAKLSRWTKVPIEAEEMDGKSLAYRIGEAQWVRAIDVRRPGRSPMPSSVHADQRWIDVDLASQTLVAYEGDRPIFATLISSGKGKDGSETATPRGEFRVWVKLTSSNMDNLEHEDAERFYSIEDVPYVQYFSNGVALHGAFWHRDFGRPRSHGCVNLAPLDARRLFRFTSPHLPAGWNAVLPTPSEVGTVIRVR